MKRLISLIAIFVLLSINCFCQSKEPISLKRLNAARTEYYDKEIIIYGKLQTSDYYNYGYNESQNTHYSFKLKDDNSNIVQVYFKKNLSKELFDKLIDVEYLTVKIKAIAYQNKQESNFGNILCEGISFELVQDK